VNWRTRHASPNLRDIHCKRRRQYILVSTYIWFIVCYFKKYVCGFITAVACGAAATRSTNEEKIRPGLHSTQKKRNTNAVKCTEYRESEAISTQTNGCKTNTEKKVVNAEINSKIHTDASIIRIHENKYWNIRKQCVVVVFARVP